MAELAKEGVTAVAWNPSQLVFYRQRDQEERPPPSPVSFSRWRPARAIAREARRLAAAATAHRDTLPDREAWSRYYVTQGPRELQGDGNTGFSQDEREGSCVAEARRDTILS